MQDISRLKLELEHLADILQEHKEDLLAGAVKNALNGSEEELAAFLQSNELWGGAGSFADQGGITTGQRGGPRRLVEACLIQLGEQQIQAGITNIRTATWVGVFKKWQREGV